MKLPTNETFKFPIIETERLILRMFEADDFDAAHLLFSDADVQKYLSPANRRTPEQMRVTLEKLATRWLERGFGIWCVCDKNSGEVIGYSGFQYFEKSSEVEILFGYLKEFWGNGYATEAARACLRYGFQTLFFEKVYAAIHPENVPSLRVLEKLEMSFEDRTEHYAMDSITFTISRENYRPEKDCYKLTPEIPQIVIGNSGNTRPRRNTYFAECFV